MNIENEKFEEWRKEQIASLVRMGYPDAAKAFRDLGSVQWAGWQAGWQASRESLVIELPVEKPMSHNHEVEAARLAFNDAIEECRDAIEAAGLKVKS